MRQYSKKRTVGGMYAHVRVALFLEVTQALRLVLNAVSGVVKLFYPLPDDLFFLLRVASKDIACSCLMVLSGFDSLVSVIINRKFKECNSRFYSDLYLENTSF
jgi:hypothetical protein